MEAAVHQVLGLASVKNCHLVKQLLLLRPVTKLVEVSPMSTLSGELLTNEI